MKKVRYVCKRRGVSTGKRILEKLNAVAYGEPYLSKGGKRKNVY